MTDSAYPLSPPKDHFVRANGLLHHVVEWRPTHAAGDAGTPTAPDGATDERPNVERPPVVWLSHGFMDFAYSWTRVAERLQRAGYRVLAHDWRGHGETEWIGAGGYYHFADYPIDLAQLIPALVNDSTALHVVGHSMGATATAMYAGVRSGRLRSVTLIEGLGPPNVAVSNTTSRFKSWFDSVARTRTKQAQRDPDVGAIADLDEALKRMRVRNSELRGEFEAWGRFLADKATRETPDGRRAWRFDPLHRTISPMPFRAELFSEFLKGIQGPTLVVLGGKGYRLPKADEEARLSVIADHAVLEIPDAGHMIPWFNEDVFGPALLEHLSAAAPDGGSPASAP